MSLVGLSLRDLEYLVAVADHRHFGRAAARCGVSQPALSAQVRKLEAFLGVVVFERIPGRIAVTERGEAVVACARAVIAAARALLDTARVTGAPLSGPFRLGVIPTLGPYLLPLVLRPLRDAFPAMRVVISEERTADILAHLRDGELDAVLACLPQDNAAFRSFPLFFEPFMLMHPPGECPPWPLRLSDERLVAVEEGHCLRDQVHAYCGPLPNGMRRHAAGLEMLRHMVAAGEGVSLVPALAVRALGVVEGLVAYTPIPDASVGRHVALIVRRTDPRAVLAALATLIRDLAPYPARRLKDGP